VIELRRLAMIAKPWRRIATIALGIVAFAVILLIGHAFGTLLASRMAA